MYKDMSDDVASTISDREESVRNAVTNILMTDKGDLPGKPTFGCGMKQYIFSNMSRGLELAIDQEIRFALGYWEPRISVDNISFQSVHEYNRLNITIEYTILEIDITSSTTITQGT